MKFAIACDPAGEVLRQPVKDILTELGVEYEDFGMNEGDPRDYPIFAVRAASAVVRGECDRGIILCGTGVGISIAANKVRGIRCCCCSDCYSAKMSRAHNDANMLALGGRVIAPELAKMIVETWVKAEFEGGRHQRRVDMFALIEDGKPLE
ncbi:MAG: ribose 5-phosphate isomerase B [Clostridiales bacterium]|nr:ribose 5-phosphate isomerase B [Clostridiales bacterium]